MSRFSVYLLLFLCLLGMDGYAQQSKTYTPHTQHAISLELLGGGGYGSIGYEITKPLKSHLDAHLRIGVGLYRIKDFTQNFNPDLLLPLSGSVTYGISHQAEIGVGNIIARVVKRDDDFEPQAHYSASAMLTAGYRFVPIHSRISFKVAYQPLLEFYTRWIHRAVLGINFRF